MNTRVLNYTRCAVICHGLSEVQIAKYIKSKLHLKIEIISHNKGESSIQITSLKKFLNQKEYKGIRKIANDKSIQIEKNKLINFKLFIIMDTDDCTDSQRESFIDKSMFKDHPLYEYIVPVYNITNLEDVLQKAGIMATRIKDKDKASYYLKTFPISKDPLTVSSYEEIKMFSDKLSKVKETNLDEFVNYALELAEQNKIHR